MSDKKISELAVGILTPNSIIPVVIDNTTVRTDLTDLVTYLKPRIDTNFTGGTISGTTNFTNGLKGSTISATTYFNLPTKIEFVTGSYSQLTDLVNSSGLTVGNRYVLNDYKTIYQINGTNSSDRTEIHTIIGSSGAYSQFDNVPDTIAADGDTVLCVYAPSGASTTTGSYVNILDYFNAGYISFSPRLTYANDIGIQIQFSKKRYPNIPSNIVINDIYGKPVIKPSGILNTEVHDGTEYMSMSAAENTVPKVETIILTAIAVDSFSREAESVTYAGDKLKYDFLDNIIYDENSNQIGTRNGFILSRENLDGSISINKDWREQKYRRYKLDTDNWNGIILKKSASGFSGTSGSTIYSMGGINFCTISNTGVNVNNAYLLSEPYEINAYTDLAKNVDNPFISGTTSAPSVGSAYRFPISNSETTYSVNISLPLSIFSGLTSTGKTAAKDFTIIPLENNYPKDIVSSINVTNLNNTVFADYGQRYGSSRKIYVSSKIGSITDSTFLTSANIDNIGEIVNIKALDAMAIDNYNTFSNSVLLANGSITNSGRVYNSTFGNGYTSPSVNEFSQYNISSSSIILNSIFGCNRVDTFILNDLNVNASIFITRIGGVSSISGKMYLTQYKNNASVYGSEINLNTFVNQKPNKGYFGYVYDFGTSLFDLKLNNFNFNKDLAYEKFDASGNSSFVIVVSGK